MSGFNPLDNSICLANPLLLAPSGWIGHIPFAMFLIDMLRPKVVVELGTHYGVSYCSFCQAVRDLKIETLCYAIDTWQGDKHAGFYGPEVLAGLKQHHDPLYGGFSKLMQSTFDEAVSHFEDGSIDLLHIDGYHTYEAVKHDFETWLPKMSSCGVIILHDTQVFESDFGIWQFWREVQAVYPHFEFTHSHGLGLLVVGRHCPARLAEFLEPSEGNLAHVREFFHELGRRLEVTQELQQFKSQMQEQLDQSVSRQRTYEAHLTQQDADLERGRAQLAAYETQLAQQGADLERNRAQVTAYEAQLMQQAADLERGRAQLAEYEGQLRQRGVGLTEAHGQIAKYEIEVARQLTETSKNRARLSDYEAQWRQSSQALTDARSELLQQEKQLSSQTEELAKVSKQLTIYETQLQQQSEVLTRVHAELAAHQIRLAQQADELAKAHEQKSSYEYRLSQMEIGLSEGQMQVLRKVITWIKTPRVRRLIASARRFGRNLDRARHRLAGIRSNFSSDSTVEVQPVAVEIQSSAEPLLSVIIPVFNQSRLTIGCLNSIKDVFEQSQLSVEVIVVDDASTDDTKEVLKQFTGIRTVTNEKNVGFIASCNHGAAVARGEYLLFLNNDTTLRPQCFEEILGTFTLKPDAGLVGAKLLYPDGRLQEAGGIIWNDGSGWNYGRMDDPEKPEYSYLREVDYCSGACLAVPKLLYQQLGGFDMHYSPAYCEDSDLAFRVRQAGFKVYYQPLAEVVHFEGMTSGKDVSENVKSYQVVNQQKLFDRWSTTLATHGESGVNPYTAKERQVNKRILVLDACVLTPDQDAGSLTVFNHIKIFQSLGYKVTFAPDNLHRYGRYTSDLQRLGIECLYYPHTKSIESHLEAYGSYYDIVFIARADVAEAHIDNIKTHCRKAKVIFDTEDLHFLREARRAELENDVELAEKALQRKEQELAIARKCDCTIVVSRYEKEVLLQEDPLLNVTVIPVPRDIPGRKGDFEERSNILFIGGFQHPPNVDGVLHFVQNIYPLIKKQLNDIKFYILGSNPPPEVLGLAADSSIIVTGYVADLAPFFNRSRLSVAPLRYGAGVKGKILTSLSYGLPVVASTVACEGIGLENNFDVLAADEPSDFAASVVRLYTDVALWNKLSANGLSNVSRNYSVSITKTAFKELFRSLGETHEAGFASCKDEPHARESGLRPAEIGAAEI